MVYLLIGAAVLIIILIAIIVLLFIKGNQPAKQDDITDKPVVTTEQTTETEMSTEQTDRKDVSGQQEASEKTSEVINKEDTTGNEDMGTDGAVGEEAEYILPESASRLLTEADLENLTQEDLRIARNEIYARHGRKFLDEGLQEYFNGKSWYNGTIEPDDFKEDMLSEIERTNEDTIVNYETKMGYR